MVVRAVKSVRGARFVDVVFCALPRILANRIEVHVLQKHRPRARVALRQVALSARVMSLGSVANKRLSVRRQSELGGGGAVSAVPHQHDGGAPIGRVERDDESRVPAGDGDDRQPDVREDARRAVVETAERVDVTGIEDLRVVAATSLVDVCPVK